MGGEPIVHLATVRALPRFNGHFLGQNDFPGFQELDSGLNHSGIVRIAVMEVCPGIFFTAPMMSRKNRTKVKMTVLEK
jgi:hypothetical protein